MDNSVLIYLIIGVLNTNIKNQNKKEENDIEH